MKWIICVFLLVFSGCQQSSKENHYTEVVPQAPAPTVPATPKMDSSADPHAGMDMDMSAMGGMMPGLENSVAKNISYGWTVPEGWKEEAGQGMRLATFHLTSDEKAIDSSIVSLAGVAGGLEANLKRWMGQIGLESSATDLTGLINAASSIKIKGGQEGKVFDFTTIQLQGKPTDKSMIVVMLPMNNATLFVKVTGTLETVKKNKDDFFKLVQSIEPKGDASSVTANPLVGGDMKDPHAGMNMNSVGSMMEKLGPPVSNISWAVPEGWKEEAAKHMRMATFHLASDPTLIDCGMIALAGAAGGVEPNLARWAGQLGLSDSPDTIAKLMAAAMAVKTKDGKDVQVYDFTAIQTNAQSTDKSMIAAILSVDNLSIFIKMTGTLDAIKKNKESYLKLISSIAHK
ncbi:MAG: hypothetical protein HQL15_00225 [Candidatus Omnitrophica bacterium]|nr:hypothetical protein [Candidatus Omnitrophota bacterium]